MSKDLRNLMKQAQQMQSKMMDMQKEIEKQVVEGTAGGGMVKITMNGKQELLSVKIDRQVVDPADIEMLEDLVLSAVNQAHEQVIAKSNDSFSGISSGLGIPGFPA